MLTRYLYEKDYCINRLEQSIICKINYYEILYWASELYYSGFIDDLWNIIWKCFYKFYAFIYPHMESYIERKQQIDAYIEVLKNLFHRKQGNIIVPIQSSHKKGRKPVWLNKFTDNKCIKNILMFISENNISGALWCVQEYYKTNNYKLDLKMLYNVLVYYYNGTIKKQELFNKHISENKLLCICSMIIMMSLNEEDINTKRIYLTSNEDDTNFIEYINNNLDKNGNIIDAYKLLIYRRLFYEPNAFSGDMLESKSLLCKTPLWKERFQLYNDIDNNDDEREHFYNKYGYEPDDYCKSIMII